MTTNTDKLLNEIESRFQKIADKNIAQGQSAYMRNQFSFYGIRATEVSVVGREILKTDKLKNKEFLKSIAFALWEKEERESQYLALQLLYARRNLFIPEDLELFEHLTVHKSWWDTVDFIAPKLIGSLFWEHQQIIKPSIEKWLISENIWLHRTALIFQLRYKENLDCELLENIITQLHNSNEFFINKAIGWILREYGKTNPQWVWEFAHKTQLHPLSQREALRIIKKQQKEN